MLETHPNAVFKTWEKPALVLPAFIEEGASVKVFLVREGGKEDAVGVFEATISEEIWYLRKGERFRFEVEAPRNAKLAAVLVVGLMEDDEMDVDADFTLMGGADGVSVELSLPGGDVDTS